MALTEAKCGILSVSKWAEAPLTPAPLPSVPLSANATKLLNNVVKQIMTKNETFTITNSPMCCPVSKNDFFALKPYFWEVQPGCPWERRDGQRNPLAEKPQCQKQLQNLAATVRPLAWASAYLQDEAARAQAEKLLKIFFLDEETRMLPEVLYAQVNLGKQPLQGDKLFVVATRHLVLVDQAIALLPSSPVVDGVKAWIQAQLTWMDGSEQGEKARTSGNNVEIWYHAVYASHLAVLDPGRAAAYAMEHLNKYLSVDPATLLAPELERTRPRHYVLFSIEPLFLLARCTFGNGNDIPAQTFTALGGLLNFAKTVPPGPIEVESDNDPRHGARIAWFERMLTRWSGGTPSESDPDGSAWEGGWNQPARLAWAMI